MGEPVSPSADKYRLGGTGSLKLWVEIDHW